MKITMKFKNGFIKEKNVEFKEIPEKFMFHGEMDNELVSFLHKLSPEKQGEAMSKLHGGVIFELDKNSENITYLEV